MTRSEILSAAETCVNGSRQSDYGTPEDSFNVIAEFWDVYLAAKRQRTITAVDVASMLSLMKIARIVGGRAKADNWVDLAGYAACGGEIDTEGEAERVDDSGR